MIMKHNFAFISIILLIRTTITLGEIHVHMHLYNTKSSGQALTDELVIRLLTDMSNK